MICHICKYFSHKGILNEKVNTHSNHFNTALVSFRVPSLNTKNEILKQQHNGRASAENNLNLGMLASYDLEYNILTWNCHSSFSIVYLRDIKELTSQICHSVPREKEKIRSISAAGTRGRCVLRFYRWLTVHSMAIRVLLNISLSCPLYFPLCLEAVFLSLSAWLLLSSCLSLSLFQVTAAATTIRSSSTLGPILSFLARKRQQMIQYQLLHSNQSKCKSDSQQSG